MTAKSSPAAPGTPSPEADDAGGLARSLVGRLRDAGWPAMGGRPVLRRVLFEAGLVIGLLSLTFAIRDPADFDETPLTLAATLPALLVLPLRRRYPFATFVLVLAGGLAGELTGAFVWIGVGAALTVASYAIGRYLQLLRGVLSLVVALALHTLALIADVGAPVMLTVLWIIAAWTVGRLTRVRAYHIAELRDRARTLELARDAHARAVLAEERSRIARELHDIIAHHVSVMTVQATAGRRVLGRDPEQADRALAEIEAAGRQALAETRRLVGVLRRSDTEEVDRAPQPGTMRLAELVQQVGETGMDAALHVEGDPCPLPSGLELTLFRVAQESLTNALKHAGPRARAEVVLRFAGDGVALTVSDDGGDGPVAPAEPATPGHGLVGMRERVALFGGTLRTTLGTPRGFTVEVWVPLPQE